jgi:hypothetical protein
MSDLYWGNRFPKSRLTPFKKGSKLEDDDNWSSLDVVCSTVTCVPNRCAFGDGVIRGENVVGRCVFKTGTWLGTSANAFVEEAGPKLHHTQITSPNISNLDIFLTGVTPFGVCLVFLSPVFFFVISD